MNGLIAHLEQHLGPVQQGWKPSSGGSKVQAVRFADQPFDGVDSYMTLGLSKTVLPMPADRQVRQELLLSVYPRYRQDHVASFLTTFADYILSNKRALLRGDVVGPATPLIPGVRATAVYSSMPVFFEETFSTYGDTVPPTVIVWLVPLIGGEAQFIREKGWERFEDELERREDVDFWSLDRNPVI